MAGKIKNERKKKKQQNILFRILFLLALAVFLYAAVRLILYGITYWKGSHEYKGLQKYVSEQPKDESSTEENGEFTVDFSGLKELNPDCIGWIRFENIDISYPIMQGEDNEYYLKHTFEGQAVTAASIFMDANNHADFSDQNTFIYGHNMKDKTMFGKLNNYKDEEFYKENPYFYIYNAILSRCTVVEFKPVEPNEVEKVIWQEWIMKWISIPSLHPMSSFKNS